MENPQVEIRITNTPSKLSEHDRIAIKSGKTLQYIPKTITEDQFNEDLDEILMSQSHLDADEEIESKAEFSAESDDGQPHLLVPKFQYSCRKCRATLFSHKDVVQHTEGSGKDVFKLRKQDPEATEKKRRRF